MIDTLDSKNPNTCQKSRDASSHASSRVAKPRVTRPRDASASGWPSNMAILQAAQVRERLDYHASACTSDAVRQGAGRTHRTQQPAARGGGSSLSVAAAAPAEPRQPRAPRQPQDAGRGPRRGSPSDADGTCVTASTAPRQPAARGSLAAAEHGQPRARAAVAATAAERRRRAVGAAARAPGRRRRTTIAATAAERRRRAVAALARGPGRRRARR